MNDVELREYYGDFADVAELARRVWIPQYGGKLWFPLWDAPFLRWQLGPESGAICPAAYAAMKLVGCTFSMPHALRMGSSVVPIALSSWFSVAPDYGRVAMPLVEDLRRRQEERGIAFSIGLVMADPSSIAYRFWTKYGETFPHKFRFLFRTGLWVKVLAADQLARAAIKGWERIASATIARALLRLIPPRPDQHMRLYRPDDLHQCAQILDKGSSAFEWALSWQPGQLARQLAESPASITFVLESQGRVQGMVNCHFLTLYGREPVRAALIDLWADDDLGYAARVRMLAHLCNDLRGRDVQLVLALRSPVIPVAVLARNLFFPDPSQFYVTALLTRHAPQLSVPRSWSLMMR